MDIDDLLARAPRAADAPAEPRLTHLVMNRVRWQARPAVPAARSAAGRGWWLAVAAVAIACACIPWPGETAALELDGLLLAEMAAAGLIAAGLIALAGRRTA